MPCMASVKDGIGGERMLIFREGAFLLALGHQVEGGIVVVFGLLAGVRRS